MWLLILLTSVFAALVYYNVIKPHSYWKEKEVAYVKPWPMIGNMAPVVFRKTSATEWAADTYKAYPEKRYVGVYQFLQPGLLIRDPELIKKITVKEFDTFPDHRTFSSTSEDPLWNKNIFFMSNKDGWHDMRATLSPSFTSSKMKAMFVLMQECSERFIGYFQKQEGIAKVELKDVFSRFTNDVIGTTAFGVTCDSLKDPENEFYMMGKNLTNLSVTFMMKLLGYILVPSLLKLFKVSLFTKEVNVFFRKLIKESLRVREEKQIVRPDMIHLMMEARKGRLKHENQSSVVDSGFAVLQESEMGKTPKKKVELTDDDITAQALLFFQAGFDTSSTLMCYTAYELALNPEIQEKLFEEIKATLEDYKGTITYEALLSMKYLDNVISESLRKWPPLAIADRKSVKPYTIEPEKSDEKPLYLEAGSFLFIPTFPIHRDPGYYPDPEKFDPDRFNDENKHNIKPYTYLPFGLGPRSCIGNRFALLETKLIIVELLRKFELIPVKETPIPIVISRKQFAPLPLPDGGFPLGFKARTTFL